MILEKAVVSWEANSANHKEKRDKLNYAKSRMFIHQRRYLKSKNVTHRLGEDTATHIQSI